MKARKRASTEVIRAVQSFPYFVLRNEGLTAINKYTEELIEIQQYYQNYDEGAEFFTEGSSGNYVPSAIAYKTASTLINKEARFMFSQSPDVNINAIGKTEEEQKQAEIYKKIVDKALEKSQFSKVLLQAAKDCFIGKRIACVVDFSEESGARMKFYTALEFYYETEYGGTSLKKFLTFEEVSNSRATSERIYLVNRYENRNGSIHMSSVLYDAAGQVLETLIEEHETDLDYIPAVIITNDGTLRDKKGVSEMAELVDYESGYSRLANADIDSERKGMNPINYTVDMNSRTTSNLSSGAGAYWDLKHDQNMDNPHPAVGKLAPDMQHTEAVKTTLDRMKNAMYNAVDVPNISEDGMLSGITSFKALTALYFPLTVRCDEKMKTWGPALQFAVRAIVDLAILNPEITKAIYVVESAEQIQYDVEIVSNYALLSDEMEEKQIDMEEINMNARSRMSYMSKWRPELKTKEQREEELMQIAVEMNMFDAASVNPLVQGKLDQMGTQQQVQNNLENIEQ